MFRILTNGAALYIVKQKEDEIWDLVKEFYEQAYKVKFTKRLPDSIINDLYDSWIKLQDSQERYLRDRAKNQLANRTHM